MPDPRADRDPQPPDPGEALTLDEIGLRLRALKIWSGDPSYDTIKDRVNAAWTASGRPSSDLTGRTTVADCFRTGRRRLNADLIVAIVAALHPDLGYLAQWRQALRIVGGEADAAAQVRVHDGLPRDDARFTGRGRELDQLRRALHPAEGPAVAIAGLAGVGKTELAVQAGRRLAAGGHVERVLFVNLRGFHPDAAQPLVDPAAVLDGFLRLLGLPDQQIPHDLPGRVAAYRERLAGTRTLVLLDNARDEAQIRPLVAQTAGCPTLITSRRSLTGLTGAVHVVVDVLNPDEAREFLAPAAAGAPVGDDPDALARIVRRCGRLPLALGLVAGHIHARPGWTLTDHADRLDERHRLRRLDGEVQMALDVLYQSLPAAHRRLLRLCALRPVQEFDTYAAAALCGDDAGAAGATLVALARDHLVRPVGPGRYVLHDLVRAYAVARAVDEDAPAHRQAALTRLFDYYLATATTAMAVLHPAHTHTLPRLPAAATPRPPVDTAATALGWLETEQATLVAAVVHTAARGWPGHAVALSTTLFRYLNGSHGLDALLVHRTAWRAAASVGDERAQAYALTNLGATCLWLGRNEEAVDHLRRAQLLHERAGDTEGLARALSNLGNLAVRRGRLRTAIDVYARALALVRPSNRPAVEARMLGNLGAAEMWLGELDAAADHLYESLAISERCGDRTGAADARADLGTVERQRGNRAAAADHLDRALDVYRDLGNRTGQALALDSLGRLLTDRGEPDAAAVCHTRALALCRATGDRNSEAWAFNGLGDAAVGAARLVEALGCYQTAHDIALELGDADQQARAHAGLGRVYRDVGPPKAARHHYERAITLYAALGLPDADRIRSESQVAW